MRQLSYVNSSLSHLRRISRLEKISNLLQTLSLGLAMQHLCSDVGGHVVLKTILKILLLQYVTVYYQIMVSYVILVSYIS